MKRRNLVFTFIFMFSFLVSSVMGAEVMEIDFWSSGGPEVRQGLEEAIEFYEAENPNIKVKLSMFSTWVDMSQRLLMSLAAGDPPDCARMKPLTAGDMASKGALEPLTPYMKKSGLDPSEFVDILIEKASVYQGVQYVLPMGASVPIMYYNVDLFKEAGLDPNTPPDTWDDLLQYSKKMTHPEKDQWGYYGHAQGAYHTFMMFLWQAGGEYMSDDLTTPLFNSEAGIEALQFMVDLVHKYEVQPPPQLYDRQEILEGNVGIWERALSGLSFFKVNAPDLNWRTARLAKNVRRTSMEMSEGSIIFSESKNKDEAWDWINFLSTDPRAGIAFYEAYGHVPTTKKVLSLPYFQEDPLVGPAVWHMLNDLNARPIMPKAQEIFNEITDEIEQAIYLRKSPEEALDDAEKTVIEIIENIEW